MRIDHGRTQRPPAKPEAGKNEWLKAIRPFGRSAGFGEIGIAVRTANVTFPLTLTLSLGEREQRALRSGKPTGLDCSAGGADFTRSPRERAGVRGNGAKSHPVRRTNPGIVELGESSGRAGGFPK